MTTENNMIIPKFMELEYYPKINSFLKVRTLYIIEELLYNSSWNWLMEVVEKIESLDNEIFGVTITKNLTTIEDCFGINDLTIERKNDSMFNNTYNACVEFIKWYNENKNLSYEK